MAAMARATRFWFSSFNSITSLPRRRRLKTAAASAEAAASEATTATAAETAGAHGQEHGAAAPAAATTAATHGAQGDKDGDQHQAEQIEQGGEPAGAGAALRRRGRFVFALDGGEDAVDAGADAAGEVTAPEGGRISR